MVAHHAADGDIAAFVGLQLSREGNEEQLPNHPGVEGEQREGACGDARLTVGRQSVIILVGQLWFAWFRDAGVALPALVL